MESENIIALKRTFSDLGKLQKPMALQYQMVAKKQELEFCVSKIQNGIEEAESQTVRNLSWQQGKQVLTFMYENAVPFECWKDIFCELIILV